ncbi:unnamed protein product, partial [Urochloa humidicola]
SRTYPRTARHCSCPRRASPKLPRLHLEPGEAERGARPPDRPGRMAASSFPALLLAAAAAAVMLLLLPPRAEAVWLELPPSGTKCVSEEIQPNVVVLADYAIMYESHPTSHPTVAVKVTSPYGNTVHHNENATTGQFAFTTTEAGNYLACFWIDSAEKGSGTSLNLDWKIGIAAKDWDTIAKKEKIEW